MLFIGYKRLDSLLPVGTCGQGQGVDYQLPPCCMLKHIVGPGRLQVLMLGELILDINMSRDEMTQHSSSYIYKPPHRG